MQIATRVPVAMRVYKITGQKCKHGPIFFCDSILFLVDLSSENKILDFLSFRLNPATRCNNFTHYSQRGKLSRNCSVQIILWLCSGHFVTRDMLV